MQTLHGASHLTRKSRPVRAERLSKLSLAGDKETDSSKTVRVQFLTQRLGLAETTASLLAPLIWGSAAP